MFATHPTPKAGMILRDRSIVAENRSLRICAERSTHGIPRGRAYKSSPRRWTGVAKNCEKMGTVNCDMIALECGLDDKLSGMRDDSQGAMVNDPKIVMASLIRNVAVAALGTPGLTTGATLSVGVVEALNI